MSVRGSFQVWIIASYIIAVTSCGHREKKATNPKADFEELPSSTLFVNEMRYFPETAEFYTSLDFLPDHEGMDRDSVISRFDSLVYSNGTLTRRSLSLEKAREIFFLTGVDTLQIYDTDHRFVSQGTLARVEYVEGPGMKSFVAVYAGRELHSDPAEEYYCMNGFLNDHFIREFSYRNINNTSLDQYIIHRLNLPDDSHVRIANIRIEPGGSTFSVVTTGGASYLTEVTDNQFAILKNMNAKYRIDRILPLPFKVNGKPLLLASLSIPGSATRTVSLAVFADYQEYRFLSYNRLSLKKEPGREVRFMRYP